MAEVTITLSEREVALIAIGLGHLCLSSNLPRVLWPELDALADRWNLLLDDAWDSLIQERRNLTDEITKGRPGEISLDDVQRWLNDNSS